jgi:ACT domain-containing protein
MRTMDNDTQQLPVVRPGDEERMQTITHRMAREKMMVIDQLRKVPIVQAACEKIKISRATFYNWKKDDADFAQQVDEAIGDGTLFMNDMAESQLLNAIRDGNLGAITYWLKHRHTAYSNRMEVTTKVKHEDTLTPEQELAVEEALRLTSFETSPQSFISHSSFSHNEQPPSSDSNSNSTEHLTSSERTSNTTQAGV